MTNAELIDWLSKHDPTLEAGLLAPACGPHALEMNFTGHGQNVGATNGELREYSNATNNVIAAGLLPNEPALILYRKSADPSLGTPLTKEQFSLLRQQMKAKRNMLTNLKTKG